MPYVYAADLSHVRWGTFIIFFIYRHSSNKNSVFLVHTFFSLNNTTESLEPFLYFSYDIYPLLYVPKTTFITYGNNEFKNALRHTFTLPSGFVFSKHRAKNIY